MFQSDNLLPFLTATENVLVQCSLNDDEDALDRARALLAQLGLAAHADAFPTSSPAASASAWPLRGRSSMDRA